MDTKIYAGMQQFSTLAAYFQPGDITDIEIDTFLRHPEDPYVTHAEIRWTPAMDMTCFYDIIFHPSDDSGSGFEVIPLLIRDVS